VEPNQPPNLVQISLDKTFTPVVDIDQLSVLALTICFRG
jgi:hypothetical protein